MQYKDINKENVCTIVATGNSLRNFDFNRLKGFVIGINHAFKYCKTDINVALDKSFIKEFNPPNLHTLDYNNGNYTRSLNNTNISFKHGVVGDFRSSLLFGLNVAILLGYKEIHILGADGYVSEYLHFFDSEKINHQATYLSRFYNLMIKIEPQLRNYNIVLYNSRMKVFTNKSLSEYPFNFS